jgi:hypothetical protein
MIGPVFLAATLLFGNPNLRIFPLRNANLVTDAIGRSHEEARLEWKFKSDPRVFAVGETYVSARDLSQLGLRVTSMNGHFDFVTTRSTSPDGFTVLRSFAYDPSTHLLIYELTRLVPGPNNNNVPGCPQ